MADQTPRSDRLRPARLFTTQYLLTVMREQGATQAARLFGDLHTLGALPADQLRPIMGELWDRCPNPHEALPRERWQRLFEHVGYAANGEPAELPAAPIQMWRGAPPLYRDSWTWTDERGLAQQFAALRANRWADSVLWTATVEPWRLLAFRQDGYLVGDWMGPGREFVVNTDGLSITEDKVS